MRIIRPDPSVDEGPGTALEEVVPIKHQLDFS
jgi:hypothetical protein